MKKNSESYPLTEKGGTAICSLHLQIIPWAEQRTGFRNYFKVRSASGTLTVVPKPSRKKNSGGETDRARKTTQMGYRSALLKGDYSNSSRKQTADLVETFRQEKEEKHAATEH